MQPFTFDLPETEEAKTSGFDRKQRSAEEWPSRPAYDVPDLEDPEDVFGLGAAGRQPRPHVGTEGHVPALPSVWGAKQWESDADYDDEPEPPRSGALTGARENPGLAELAQQIAGLSQVVDRLATAMSRLATAVESQAGTSFLAPTHLSRAPPDPMGPATCRPQPEAPPRL